MTRTDLLRRSIVKAVTYRLPIVTLDFVTLYALTGTVKLTLGFIRASNIYTTVSYFGHERLWAHVRWGFEERQAIAKSGA
jgi:uncharacterized membrane protein